jgi:hypothetical protein
MKLSRLARCLPRLLLALCPPLLGHCGGAVEHGTETGNPPVVEQQKLHVGLHDDGVVVVGDPGAVSPGATVVVTNVRSGERSEASAGADGSVSVSVPGTLDDEYEVTVSSGGRSQTVLVSASAGASAELASASCDSLEQEPQRAGCLRVRRSEHVRGGQRLHAERRRRLLERGLDNRWCFEHAI